MFASMLAPDPAKRFRSMKDVVAAANRLKERVAEPKDRSARTQSGRPWFKSPLAWTSAGIGAVVIASVVIAVLWPRLYPSSKSAGENSAPPSSPSNTIVVDAAGGTGFTKISDALA